MFPSRLRLPRLTAKAIGSTRDHILLGQAARITASLLSYRAWFSVVDIWIGHIAKRCHAMASGQANGFKVKLQTGSEYA